MRAVIHNTAERLRNEPWKLIPFRSNCLGKSLRFKQECSKAGIDAKVVLAVVAVHNTRFSFLPSTLIGFHVWAEIDGQRVELARPHNEPSPWGCFDTEMRRVFAVEI